MKFNLRQKLNSNPSARINEDLPTLNEITDKYMM